MAKPLVRFGTGIASHQSVTPVLVDTTLREGLQSVGVQLSIEARLETARRLVSAGIQELEVGTPATGRRELEAVKETLALALPARLLTWNRAVEKDIQASLTAGARSLYISAPVSDLHIEQKLRSNRSEIQKSLEKMIHMAHQEGCYVVAGLEDATRADPDFLEDVCAQLHELYTNRIRLADTVGILTPESSRELFSRMSNRFPVSFESHCHNDFGLATANTIQACLGGASHIDVTLLGVGERSGNAALEEVVLAMEFLYKIRSGFRMDDLHEIVTFFSEKSGIPIPALKGGVGRLAFTHSSGLHVHGVLKDPSTYEPFDPAQIGRARSILIGPHSGSSAVRSKALEFGFALTDSQTECILTDLKNNPHPSALSDADFLSLLHQHANTDQ